ncbi:hypothetical protein [Changchengzhania lutea]|uniref:hypothetical protein n=1 Tax=Changchengzhania lutea TaxID=2049305 RepID=UPI00115CAFA1|nr:hypothetical protein [Changchengzhania lutea]
MNSRWCISTLIVILTLFGVVCQQQMSAPNQEIILQFTDAEVTSDEAQTTFAIVKQQLRDLGADNIQVTKQPNGSLKITYYSDTDVASIKKIFSKDLNVSLDYNSNTPNKERHQAPSDNEVASYNLDVYEIQDGNNTLWGSDGKYVLEPKLKTDQFFNPNILISVDDIEDISKNKITSVAFKVREQVTISIGDILHKIPEVRAGPVC